MTGAPGAARGMPDLSSFASLFGTAPATPTPAPAPAPVFSLSAIESAFDTVSECNCVAALLLILDRYIYLIDPFLHDSDVDGKRECRCNVQRGRQRRTR